MQDGFFIPWLLLSSPFGILPNNITLLLFLSLLEDGGWGLVLLVKPLESAKAKIS
jgi:hypothetical protein